MRTVVSPSVRTGTFNANSTRSLHYFVLKLHKSSPIQGILTLKQIGIVLSR